MSVDNVPIREALEKIAGKNGIELNSESFAEYMDNQDELATYREMFHYPKNKTVPGTDLDLVDGTDDSIYLCGNSLGLCPKQSMNLIKEQVGRWEDCGVIGWFDGKRPWADLVEQSLYQVAGLVGAEESEVMLMNTLTVNLHMMMVSFYRPTPQRHKILVEGGLFPSDLLTVNSQMKFHDLDPKESLVMVDPRPGEETLRTEDIVRVIEEQGEEIALIMFSGIQFYTGQFFDMEAITAAGHRKGCYVGFDLAHAVGNVELKLHDWNVDWAAWCCYKYLNGGPGVTGGIFVHKNHDNNTELKRLDGWWGVDLQRRMEMENDDLPLMKGAKGYAQSCNSALATVPLLASLELFHSIGMAKLIKKQKLLTGFLEYLIWENFDSATVQILTPSTTQDRGCQLSLSFTMNLDAVFGEMKKHGVVVDVRRSHVIRVAPAPLYNSFNDVFRFVSVLKKIIKCNSQ